MNEIKKDPRRVKEKVQKEEGKQRIKKRDKEKEQTQL